MVWNSDQGDFQTSALTGFDNLGQIFAPNTSRFTFDRAAVEHGTSAARADSRNSGESNASARAIGETETKRKSFRIEDEGQSEADRTRVAISKAKAKSSLTSDGHNLRYAGRWRGAITCGEFQNVEHVIVIDNNEKMITVSQVVSGSGGVNASAAAFIGADGLTVKFPWPNGTWALKPNPDGKTAHVRLTSTFGPFSMDNSATFHREP